jgi:hypothetical protein
MKLKLHLLAVLLLVLPAACSSGEVQLPGLREVVKQKIASQDATPIALARETPFAWDRVFIFEPYRPYEEVLREIGVSWEDVQKTGIATRDDAVLLVFLRSGEVTAFTMYPRGDGDLAEVRAPGGLTPEQALFVARRVDRGGPWTILELADGKRREKGEKE